MGVIGGLVWWNNGLRDRIFPKNFGIVEEGVLYRAGRLQPEMIRRVVGEHKIKTIIDLGADAPGSARDNAAAAAARELGVDRVRFNLLGDGSGNPNYYVEALRIMSDPARQPVLVQCGAGAQRTGAACILYRHAVQGKSIDEAYVEASKYRHDPGKDWRMLAYLAEWNDEIEEAWREGRAIEGVEPVAIQLQPRAAEAPAAPIAEGGEGG